MSAKADAPSSSVLSGTVTDVSQQTRRRMGPTILRFEHARISQQQLQQQGGNGLDLEGVFTPSLDYSFEDESPRVHVTLKSKHVDYSNKVPSVQRK